MTDDVVVVAARDAWPEYQHHGAYVCQPERPFRREATRLAFYAQGAIQPLVPAIEQWMPAITFTAAAAEVHRSRGDERLGVLIERLLRAGPRREGERFGVMFLSAPDDEATVRLPGAIVNDRRTPEGRRVAWTRWQRYTSLEALTSGVTVTSQL